ncbi:MAG: hypothetical protein R3348_04600 [Xanthomonadales bacterium]|nr:hypothetical protein [Xanthomonadales bacterium]
MMTWLRRNGVLVAGIVLPVLLIVGFLLLQKAPSLLEDPPQYDFLLVAYRYDAQHPRDFHLSFEVREGRLFGRATPGRAGQHYPNRQHAGLFRYDASTQAFDEIIYELPPGIDNIDEEPLTFEISEASRLRLDKSKRSPDGYTFEFLGYRGGGGLLGELFGMRRRYDNPYVLSRDGAHFALPRPEPGPHYYAHDLHFLGWIVDKPVAP